MPSRRPPSRDRFRGGFPPPSRPIPVHDGVTARSRRGQIGETWWSRRFVDLLESLGLGGRLDRGKTYARKGQVLSIELAAGEVAAPVQGSRATPYEVRIAVPVLDDQQWVAVTDALASRALFLARLLAGEMPHEIEAVFEDCGLSLFPRTMGDLTTSCSCPDWSNPCKHVAAVLYLLGEAFDEDPFLILQWRGRGRDELLEELRALRGAAGDGGVQGGGGDDAIPAEDLWQAVEAVRVEAVTTSSISVADAFWRVRLRGPAPDLAPDLEGQPGRGRHARGAVDAVLRERTELPRTVDGKPLGEVLAGAYTVFASATNLLLADETGTPPAT